MGSGRTYVIGSFNLHNLSRNRATRDQAVQICNIIMHEGMDLIAMQEVLDDRALDNIMACLGYNWEKVIKIREERDMPLFGIVKD